MNKAEKIFLIISTIAFVICVIFILFIDVSNNIEGIENYNKEYFIEKYHGDLDSNLSIFPDDKSILKNAEFSSSFNDGLFDVDGYIILSAKYNENEYNREIDRLNKISVDISNCNKEFFTNNIKYDEISYNYPAYISIDGFSCTYEYALLDKDNLQIIYIYLSYPSINNKKYNKYLKKDKSVYFWLSTWDLYSMYNHSFDNGKSYVEFDDCK